MTAPRHRCRLSIGCGLGVWAGCGALFPAEPAGLAGLPPPLYVSSPAAAVPPAAEPAIDAPIPLTLREAIGVALDNSAVVRTLDAGTASVTGFDPSIANQRVREAEAVFDPKAITGYRFGRYNQPPNSTFGPGLSQPDRRDEGTGTAELSKLWAAGTQTDIGYAPSLGYLNLPNNPPGAFNPLYASNLQVRVRQPLLRGFGRDYNTAPIRVARLRADQTTADLRDATQALVRGVEEIYWELYAAREAAAAVERTLALAREIVRVQQERLAVERAIPADVARARAEVFRFERLDAEARGRVAVTEARLRDLMGIGFDGPGWLTPADRPEARPVPMDHAAAVAIALQRRPDLLRRRLEIERRGVELRVAEINRRPRLDVNGLYQANGTGNAFDDSLRQAGGLGYTDWAAGVSFEMPLGNRAPAANARAAELSLARDRAVLRRSEQAAALEVERLLREVEFAWARHIRAAGQARENAEWLRAAGTRFADPPPRESGGDWLTGALTDLMLAMRTQAEAETEAAATLAEHSILLARLEEAKGTILDARAVEVEEEGTVPAAGPPPLGPPPLGPPPFRPAPAVAPPGLPPARWGPPVTTRTRSAGT